MIINFRRLNHIQLCIPIGKEEQAREFYCEVLGLKEIEKPNYLKVNGGFWLQIANIELHIGVEDFENRSKRHPAFEVDRLDEIKETMKTAGMKIKEDSPIKNFRRFSFYDPFNNRIELLEKIDQ